jgi:hypothetical protein
LPGIQIERGGLVIDEARLAHGGDLLHEAGHLAVTPASERPLLSGTVPEDGGAEMAAIAWSWAACVRLSLPASVLFHDAGYKGNARSLREGFAAGRYVGVPLLQWMGLTNDPAAPFDAEGPQYPAMIRWLRS